MYWNYRLVKRKYPKAVNNDQVVIHPDGEILEIKEIYYDKNENIDGFGDAPVPYGETIEEVKECLDLMYKALKKPVLNYEDII